MAAQRLEAVTKMHLTRLRRTGARWLILTFAETYTPIKRAKE